MKNRRYILFLQRGNRGCGLLSVHAKSPREAAACGKMVIGRRNITVYEAVTFTVFEKTVRTFAVNELIRKNTRI